MTTPDYCEVTWSPTRSAAIVRMTVEEIPYDECDEAAHQLLACGNLARRINTPPAKRTEYVDTTCEACSHVRSAHQTVEGNCARSGCHCVAFVDETDPEPLCAVCSEPRSGHTDGHGIFVSADD